MGLLFEARSKLDQIIRDRNLDRTEVYGTVGLKAGFLVSLLKADTPDDAGKVEKLRQAVHEVLNASV